MSFAALLIAALLAPAEPTDLPLYEQEPFDRVTLDAANDNAVLEVEPLDLPERRVPEKPKPGSRLQVRWLSRPGVDYEVPWQAVEKVELFEQMVLAEAERLVAEGKLEEAYDYFAFLQRNYGELPGLAEAMETYLYEEAKAAHRAGRFDLALAMLRETYARNPQREGLDKALGLATGRLVDDYAAQHDYAAVRALVANLDECFPGHEVAAEWEARLQSQAAKLQEEARAAAGQERFGEAARLSREVAAVWPELPGARELAEEIHGQYPRVVVAVSESTVAGGLGLGGLSQFSRHEERATQSHDPSAAKMGPSPLPGPASPHAAPANWFPPAPAGLIDWAGRRTARLRYRTLLELTAPGTDGGRYICPLGQFATEELGRRLVFELRPGSGWSRGNASLTGADVARRLLAAASRGSAGFEAGWADLMASVSTTDVYRVEVDLLRVHVRPERLLQTVVPPVVWPGPPEPVPGNGPYRLEHQENGRSVFTAWGGYHARQSGQPAEIVERPMEPGRAVAELRAGAVDVIDRVAPWLLGELREEASQPDAAIVVEPYAFPLVHCLIPRPNGGLTSRRSFRRALVYGIDRERILRRLLAERDVPGCEVADGPFPRGYARDPEVAARPYDPHLAAALASVARRELEATVARLSESTNDDSENRATVGRLSESTDNDSESRATVTHNSENHATVAPLVLAHPANPVAHAACGLIQRHLAAAGIEVGLRPLAPEETAGAEQGRFPEDVDLLYVELAAWEPAADAARLFGPGGLCSHGSCYVQLGLRRLADAADWPAARTALSAIHRAVHDEVSVIPLWQLTEHFARRTDLEGVSPQPVTLYQNVEDWRPAFRFATP